LKSSLIISSLSLAAVSLVEEDLEEPPPNSLVLVNEVSPVGPKGR